MPIVVHEVSPGGTCDVAREGAPFQLGRPRWCAELAGVARDHAEERGTDCRPAINSTQWPHTTTVDIPDGGYCVN